MRLCLVKSDYHLLRDKPPVIGAAVYKTCRGEQKLTENSRFFIQDADGIWTNGRWDLRRKLEKK